MTLGGTLAGLLVSIKHRGDAGTWRVAVVLTTVVFLLSVGQLVKGFRHRQVRKNPWQQDVAPRSGASGPLDGYAVDARSSACDLLYGGVCGSPSPLRAFPRKCQPPLALHDDPPIRDHNARSERTTLRAVEDKRLGVPITCRDARARRERLGGGTVSLSVIAAMFATALAVAASNVSTIDAMSWLIESTGGVAHW